MNTTNTPSASTPAPPATAQKFVRYVLGFGVSVAVGLAPYLGKIDVPLFAPLLKILPPSEHDVVIPVSAALMGIIAVVVQWYASERVRRSELRRVFVRTALSSVVALFGLYVVNTLTVSRVPVGDSDSAVILHGFGDARCAECDGKASVECLRHITFDPGRVESCWGSTQVKSARISLALSYFAATGLFGAIIGLLVVGGTRRR